MRDDGLVKVEILHIDACPSWENAGARVRDALDAAGLEDVAIEFRRLQTPADAASVTFAGSPTILVDGVDLFPGERTLELACRVYPTPQGLSGTPTTEQLTEAIVTRGR